MLHILKGIKDHRMNPGRHVRGNTLEAMAARVVCPLQNKPLGASAIDQVHHFPRLKVVFDCSGNNQALNARFERWTT
jgi:hypothetical protein